MALPTEYPIVVALDLIPGHVIGSRVGQSDDIDTGFMLLSNVTSSAIPTNWPAVAQQMQVVSSSAADDGSPVGTGANEVEITYLTSPTNSQEPFKKKTEIVVLNGVAAVTTHATDIFRIDRFRVSKVGTGHFAVGNISLQSVGGATTFERIDIGTNVNRTCVHFVPKEFGCQLNGYTIGCSSGAGVIFILEETELDPSNNDVSLGQTQIELINQGIHIRLTAPHVIKNIIGKIMFFAIVVKGRVVNQMASGSIHYIDFPL